MTVRLNSIRLRKTGLKTAVVAATAVAVMAPAFVAAGNASAATATKIVLTTNATSFQYQQQLKIGYRLLGAPGKSLLFYATVPGVGTTRLYIDGSTNAQGFGVTGFLARNTMYITAKYAGDATHAPSSAVVHVLTAAKVATEATGGTKSGSYRYYKAGAKADFAAGVAPNKNGQKVYFPLQVLSGGAWKTVIENGYALNSDSVVGIYYQGRTGYRYRVRAEYKGDKANIGTVSAWTYAKFG